MIHKYYCCDFIFFFTIVQTVMSKNHVYFQSYVHKDTLQNQFSWMLQIFSIFPLNSMTFFFHFGKPIYWFLIAIPDSLIFPSQKLHHCSFKIHIEKKSWKKKSKLSSWKAKFWCHCLDKQFCFIENELNRVNYGEIEDSEGNKIPQKSKFYF